MVKKKGAPKGQLSKRKIREMVFFAGEACLEKKAEDVVVMDLRKVSDLADFFLVAGGYTDIHVRAITEHVIEELERRYETSPWHVEGLENGRWALVDYFDFVVHVFQPEPRNFYQLERLWADAGRHEIKDPAAGTEVPQIK